MLQYMTIPVTELMQNCSLVWCDETNEAVLVDPGGEPDRLMQAVEDKGLTLTAIWLTHGHLDHAGGAQTIREQLSVPVIGPGPEDEFLLQSIEQQCQMFGLSGLRNVSTDRYLAEGDELVVGNHRLTVLQTPGHTPGHLSFIHDQQKLAWVGDVLFAGSIGRTDFERSNHEHLIRSVAEKLWPLSDEYRFIPGHGPESTFAEQKQSNPYVSLAALAARNA
ncbi:MBL fold metallo-hydrolase [Reinekea thalattae]|uniref:MBL fold metallo-hydrolase n=1 Tax=Reinekea thalattae TaxID=2593301 RepID=A0A5C8YZZ9_9GAMM|nr:MBL fold metallo-hydrolase [Reinekea thalattae]TXR51445.1 MBL fold metallo-hydrolase [Reinekea thalattae]